MTIKRLLFTTAFFAAVVNGIKSEATYLLDPSSNEFIEYINSFNTTWKAGRNFRSDTPRAHFHRLMGVIRNSNHRLPTKYHTYENIQIPKEFDARTQWPYCPTLREIRDQGSCGSCWAISAVEAMSDRICILSKGHINIHVSVEDLLSCCSFCCDGGDGCDGGNPSDAWTYWVREGIVSGGQYHSNQGCRPYTISPCEHHVNGTRPPCSSIFHTPGCEKECRTGYDKNYTSDLSFGRKGYGIGGKGDSVQQIQMEIMQNGPVQAGITVYQDFLVYKTGVYKHVAGEYLGEHAIKILGWGVDKISNAPYWLCANSWNSDWGDNGFMKILRGTNECDIETHIDAGLPKF